MSRSKQYLWQIILLIPWLIILYSYSVNAQSEKIWLNAPDAVVKGCTFTVSVEADSTTDGWTADFSSSKRSIIGKTKELAVTANFKAKKAGTAVIVAIVKIPGEEEARIVSKTVKVLKKAPVKSIYWGSKVNVNKTGTSILLSNSTSAQKTGAKGRNGWKVKKISGSEDNTTLYVDMKKGKHTYRYTVLRQKYTQYKLTFGKMGPGTAVRFYQTGENGERTEVLELKYKKKPSAKVKVSGGKKIMEFKTAADISKRLKKYFGDTCSVNVKKKKIVNIKLPVTIEMSIENPGQSTALQKIV